MQLPRLSLRTTTLAQAACPQRAPCSVPCCFWRAAHGLVPRVRALIGLIRQIDLSESLASPLAPDSPSRGSSTVAGSLGGPHQRVAG